MIHLPFFCGRKSTRRPPPSLQCWVASSPGAQDEVLPEVREGLDDGGAKTGREKAPEDRTGY